MNYITDEELEAVFKTGLNKSHVEGLRAVWNTGYDRANYVPPVVPTYTTDAAYVAPPAYVAPVAPVAPVFVKVAP